MEWFYIIVIIIIFFLQVLQQPIEIQEELYFA